MSSQVVLTIEVNSSLVAALIAFTDSLENQQLTQGPTGSFSWSGRRVGPDSDRSVRKYPDRHTSTSCRFGGLSALQRMPSAAIMGFSYHFMDEP